MSARKIESLRDEGSGLFVCPSCHSQASDAYDYPYCLNCSENEMLSAIDREPQVCPEASTYAHNGRQCVACQIYEGHVRDKANRLRAEQMAKPLADVWYGVSGEAFDPDEPESLPCVLQKSGGGFAFSPGIHILFGTRGSLKTWLAYAAVVQEVQRGRWALIVDYELSFKTTMRRLRVLGCPMADLQRVVYVKPPGPISDAGRGRLLSRFGTPPSVVVIDSVGMGLGVSGLEENSGTASAQWFYDLPLWLKEQWTSAVVLAIDHLPKAAGGQGSDPIGSQRKGAIADGLWLVTKTAEVSRSSRGRGNLKVQKSRDGYFEEGQVVLGFEFGGGGSFDVVAPSQNEGSDDPLLAVANDLTRIAEHVRGHPGSTVQAVRDALGIHPNTFTKQKKLLVDDGILVHVPNKGLTPGPGLDAYLADD